MNINWGLLRASSTLKHKLEPHDDGLKPITAFGLGDIGILQKAQAAFVTEVDIYPWPRSGRSWMRTYEKAEQLQVSCCFRPVNL